MDEQENKRFIYYLMDNETNRFFILHIGYFLRGHRKGVAMHVKGTVQRDGPG